jgi:hypothetical protein
MSRGAPFAWTQPQAWQSINESARRFAVGFSAMRFLMNVTSAAVTILPRYLTSFSMRGSIPGQNGERKQLFLLRLHRAPRAGVRTPHGDDVGAAGIAEPRYKASRLPTAPRASTRSSRIEEPAPGRMECTRPAFTQQGRVAEAAPLLGNPRKTWGT